MHCPSCGHQSSLEQKFCRQCGFNLEPVSKLITGGSEERVAPDKSEHERLLVRRMFRWLSWGCLMLFVGIILLVLNKGFIHAPPFQVMATIFMLTGVALATYGCLSSISKGTYLPDKIAKGVDEIGPGHPTKELPEARIPTSAPSVTERTTQLIGEEIRTDRD
jgi:hypothetical protein